MLSRELQISEREVYRLPGPLDLRGLFTIADVDRSDLEFPTFVPRTHPDLAPTESSKAIDLFAAIRHKDVLVQHPYNSFSTSVQAFIEQAAADPKVLAIKQTLYRTSGDSPIIDALIDAADAGKQVLAVVEIKARFDEVNNISWARKLEQAGVHVVYGVVGLKTHAKLCLVVRQESEGLVRYCHVGTGNYNPKTARVYEDYGLFTCDPQVGEDISRLFNQLSGFAPRSRFKRLLVAPRTVRSGLISLIEDEIDLHRGDPDDDGNGKGSPRGRIVIKANSIVDEALIDALYRASIAGVRVDIWVRGICALRPGVEGLSDNIRVRSILGRFLEHSRIFWFDHGGDPQVFLGSADMMHRNLDRRVEALVRITRPRAHRRARRRHRPRLRRDDVPLGPRLRRSVGASAPHRGRRAARRPAGPASSSGTTRDGGRRGGADRVVSLIPAAGTLPWRRAGRPARGRPRPPAQVRRLVLAQGQARPGRAALRRRGPRDPRGDRSRRPARPPLPTVGVCRPRLRRRRGHQGGPLLGRRGDRRLGRARARDRRGPLGRRPAANDLLDYARDREQLLALVRTERDGVAADLARRRRPARQGQAPRSVEGRRPAPPPRRRRAVPGQRPRPRPGGLRGDPARHLLVRPLLRHPRAVCRRAPAPGPHPRVPVGGGLRVRPRAGPAPGGQAAREGRAGGPVQPRAGAARPARRPRGARGRRPPAGGLAARGAAHGRRLRAAQGRGARLPPDREGRRRPGRRRWSGSTPERAVAASAGPQRRATPEAVSASRIRPAAPTRRRSFTCG